jgi:hypothetical protein
MLKNKGVYELFRALEFNESVENLDIADNQFGNISYIYIYIYIYSSIKN